METPDSHSRQVKVSLVVSLALMPSCLLTYPYSFCTHRVYYFIPTFVLAILVLLRVILDLQAIVLINSSLYRLSPSGGKIDRFPLIFPLKGVRVWIVRYLPSSRPYFRAGYWVDNDDEQYFSGLQPVILTYPHQCYI